MQTIKCKDSNGKIVVLKDMLLFTDKTDIHDNEIYENDVVWLANTERAKVIFENCSFKLEILEGDFAGRKEELGYWKQIELEKEKI